MMSKLNQSSFKRNCIMTDNTTPEQTVTKLLNVMVNNKSKFADLENEVLPEDNQADPMKWFDKLETLKVLKTISYAFIEDLDFLTSCDKKRISTLSSIGSSMAMSNQPTISDKLHTQAKILSSVNAFLKEAYEYGIELHPDLEKTLRKDFSFLRTLIPLTCSMFLMERKKRSIRKSKKSQ